MKMEDKIPVAKAKRVPKLKKGASLVLRGFPYTITNELLAGKAGDKHIRAIQNWEKENDVQVIGTLIVTD